MLPIINEKLLKNIWHSNLLLFLNLVRNSISIQEKVLLKNCTKNKRINVIKPILGGSCSWTFNIIVKYAMNSILRKHFTISVKVTNFYLLSSSSSGNQPFCLNSLAITVFCLNSLAITVFIWGRLRKETHPASRTSFLR